jgi:TolB protein
VGTLASLGRVRLVTPIALGSLIALLAAATGLAGSPSPTGQIVFATAGAGDSDIAVLDLGTRRTTVLTRNRAADFFPRWSPDGSRVVFVSDRGGDDDLYVMRADGTSLRRLTRTRGAREATPAWSPDGRRILFARSTPAREHDVYVIDATGRNERRLTRGRSTWIDIAPAVSPDGSTIVIASNRMPDGNLELFTLTPSGRILDRLTHTPVGDAAAGDDNLPDWSPDGTSILFTSTRDANGELYVTAPDGSAQTRLTRTPGTSEFAPRWSPDGGWIVYVRETLAGRNPRIEIARADGSSPVVLRRGADPDWR